MSTPFRRTLPDHPDLDQQKKQARELLRAFRRGEAEAAARVRTELPDKGDIRLTDAQFVIAREYGFASWPALKAVIETMAREALPLRERLRAAVHRADAHELRRLLERHAEAASLVNAPLFPFDSPALVHLAGRSSVEVIDVLLEFGADPNLRSGWWAGGFHALHGASHAVAERLLAAGAVADACAAAHLDRADLLADILATDPARVHERGGDGQTPLHFARSREIADMLLEAGADPDARDIDHRATPAQWMLDRRHGAGRYHLAAYLVDRGAAADIFLAAALGMTERVRAMVRADATLLDLRTSRGEYGERPPSSFHIYTWTLGPNLSPMQVAAQFGQTDALDALRAFASPRQRFLGACARGDEAEARALLRADPELPATLRPEDQRALPDAGWSGDTRAVRLMLEMGFDPATPGHDTGTVLHCAAWEGVADCVGAVLEHPAGRALVNRRESRYRATPLGWCCHGSLNCGNARSDHAAVARLLLAAGAEPGPDTAEASDAVLDVLDERRRPTG